MPSTIIVLGFDLTGKVAVVTGSGRGFGLAYAHALAATCARAVAVCMRDQGEGGSLILVGSPAGQRRRREARRRPAELSRFYA